MRSDRTLADLYELTEKLLIVQLRLGGVGQKEIRAIVGGDVNRISAIIKHVRVASEKARR